MTSATSPVVEYGYTDGSSNHVRLTEVTYPDGRQLDYGYGSAGSESDRTSRITTIDDGATTLATYEYAGSGMLVTTTQNEPGIEKTLHLGSGSDPYSALDRFGRMIDLRWTKSSTNLVHFEYAYDRVSNRLNQRNLVTGSGGTNPGADSLFEYDQLNRLTKYQGGELNLAGDAITSPVIEQDFTLDETGNFKGFLVKDSGATTLNQSRTHNTVNEITNITETVGSSWVTPAFNTAGSMTTIPQPADLTLGFTGTWDAWNRLVKLEASSQTVATYEYDGTNRRITKGIYSAGTLSSTRHVYYSTQAQALEERVDSATTSEIQFVWNLDYIGDLLLRDRDTNSNGTLDERLYSLPDLRYCVMALADSSGSIVERFKYQPYGQAQVMSDLFVDRSNSSYAWEFRYTGRRVDLETGLFYFRARYYHTQLARFISRDPLGFVDGMSLYRAYFVPNHLDPWGKMIRMQDVERPDFTTDGWVEVSDGCKCVLKICSNKIDSTKGIAGHLYITLRSTCSQGEYTYRGGPTGIGEPQREECKCTAKRGQLVYDSGLYQPGWVDFPEKENCREFEVAGGPSSCRQVHQCFEKVGKAIDKCCLNYGAGGQQNPNSNSVVAWLMQRCVGMRGPVRLPGPQIHPGVGHRLPQCVRNKLAAEAPKRVRPKEPNISIGVGTTLNGGNTYGK